MELCRAATASGAVRCLVQWLSEPMVGLLAVPELCNMAPAVSIGPQATQTVPPCIRLVRKKRVP